MASLRTNLLLLLSFAAAAQGTATATSMRFYMHDTVSGPSPSAVRVARGPNSTGFSFGDVFVVDDPLTEGPAADSRLVGRAQGFYAFVSQRADAPALLLSFNLVFANASTVEVVGHDPISAPVREMPVVGGSGAFRLASGYVLARTHTVNTSTGDAVLKWEMYLAGSNSTGGDLAAATAPSPNGLSSPSSSSSSASYAVQLPLLLFIFIVHVLASKMEEEN
ncbi:dirigent protein 21-like [Curcuma longa]|uniref:dirigent protein 21-like n=1 Tax=Curcuma longa TaxID=136217 RepID=UPI003D9F6B2F